MGQIALQVRVAKATMVIEVARAELVALANDQAHRGRGVLGRLDDRLEPVGIEGDVVDGDDLSCRRQSGFEGRAIPEHLLDLPVLLDAQAY